MSTINALEGAVALFNQNFQLFKNNGGFSTKELELAVEKLYNSAIIFRNSLYQTPATKPYHICNAREHLKEILQESEAPFPLALKLIKTLSSDEIQYNDRLKCLLSKTAMIFWELIVFKSVAEERNVYCKTKKAVIEDLTEVLKTLPKREVETRFYIRCLMALMKKLEAGEGKVKELIKENAPELIKGAIEMICSAGPAGANPSSLIFPLIDLSISIYRELEEKWYRNVWSISWIFSGGRVTQISHFEKIKLFTEECSKESKQAFYISKLYFEILSNALADKQLKSEVFRKATPNLLELASISDAIDIGNFTLRKDRFWKVRYITAKHLAELVKQPGYRKRSMEKLFERYTEEKNPYVGEVLFKVFTSFIEDKENKNHIREALKKIDLAQKIKDAEAVIARLQNKIDHSDGEKQEGLKIKLRQKMDELSGLELLKTIKSSMHTQSQVNELSEAEALAQQMTLPQIDEEILKTKAEYQALEKESKVLEESNAGINNQLDRLRFLSKIFENQQNPQS